MKPDTYDGAKALHAPARVPTDSRPYRRASETADELTFTGYGRRHTFRHIGWHGQTGAFYSLGEDPSKHEPGSFTPLWLPVASEDIDEPPTEAELAAAQLDMNLDLMRTAGLALGGMIGRAKAALDIFERGVTDAIDGETSYAAEAARLLDAIKARYCEPCGDHFGPLHACFEDEPSADNLAAPAPTGDPAREPGTTSGCACIDANQTDPAQARLDELRHYDDIPDGEQMPPAVRFNAA